MPAAAASTAADLEAIPERRRDELALACNVCGQPVGHTEQVRYTPPRRDRPAEIAHLRCLQVSR
jgi:hypothetical protein